MIRLALLTLVAALLAACASPMRAPDLAIAEDDRARTVLLGLMQQEIQVDKPDVNAGGGLIGAIIEGIAESTMDKNRQEALGPIRNALADYPFEPRLRAAVDSAWPDRYFAAERETVVLRSPEEQIAALVDRNGATLGTLNVRYAFSPNFDVLYVAAGVRVGDLGMVRDGKGKARDKYRSTEASKGRIVGVRYLAVFPLEDSGPFKENALRWEADGAALARAALDAGISEIADLIRRDLASPLAGDEARQERFLEPTGSGLLLSKGALIERRDGRRLLSRGPLLVWTAADVPR